MAKNELTRKLEKILFRWHVYIPDDGIPMFREEMKEVIELSKKYKR